MTSQREARQPQERGPERERRWEKGSGRGAMETANTGGRVRGRGGQPEKGGGRGGGRGSR